jgi:hypothetical protein
MDFAAFLSLEDITEALPSYREEVLAVEMDGALREAYEKLEDDIKEALKAYRGNQSVLSVSMNALLLYPDKPFGLGDLTAFAYNPETQERERILISSPPDLDASIAYAKERRLVEEVKFELSKGRRCQIFAVFTPGHDVTQRLAALAARRNSGWCRPRMSPGTPRHGMSRSLGRDARDCPPSWMTGPTPGNSKHLSTNPDTPRTCCAKLAGAVGESARRSRYE